jgi:hypothetical protein
LSLSLILLCAATTSAVAQPRPACDDPAYRAFDFWLGEWTVTNSDGVAGRNVIEAIQGGCALREQWTGAKGNTGTSLNAYDPGSGQWQQFWVDASGSVLHLRGKATRKGMVLSGETVSPDGKTKVKQRITWTANDDGSVRQLWESSADGSSWTVAFDGLYRHP